MSMNSKVNHSAFILFVAVLVLTLGTTVVAQNHETILVGHLTYHTGPFADVGPMFDGFTDFTLEIINQNPPLGREMVVIHEDIGTIGEARAARKLVEYEGVEILLNPAHNYSYYRDWVVGFVANNNRPAMPSVHGGAIDRALGGTTAEPIFRGSPMDSTQSVAAMIHAQQMGAQNIVIIATDIEGHLLQKVAAEQAAAELGLEILDVITVQPELPNYRREVEAIKSLEPDAVLVFTAAIDGGLIVRDAAAAGLDALIIGTTEWQSSEFLHTVTSEALEALVQPVVVIAFANADSPAWEFYAEQWDASPYADLAEATNSYALQYYDLLNVTALAIEAAGTTEASVWADYVRLVAEAPGTVVYTYQEGIEALRRGEDIDYSGVTGDMTYNDTGVVSGLFGVFEWADTGTLQLVSVLDEAWVMALDN